MHRRKHLEIAEIYMTFNFLLLSVFQKTQGQEAVGYNG